MIDPVTASNVFLKSHVYVSSSGAEGQPYLRSLDYGRKEREELSMQTHVEQHTHARVRAHVHTHARTHTHKVKNDGTDP